MDRGTLQAVGRRVTRFVDEHVVGVGSIGILIVLVAVYSLVGWMAPQAYSHCAEPPPPLAGFTCMDYMPTVGPDPSDGALRT